MAVLRIGLLVIVVLAIIHLLVAIIQRRAKLAELEKEWLAAGQPQAWEEYSRFGMASLERSLKRRLIYGVYLIPGGVIALLIALTNWT